MFVEIQAGRGATKKLWEAGDCVSFIARRQGRQSFFWGTPATALVACGSLCGCERSTERVSPHVLSARVGVWGAGAT